MMRATLLVVVSVAATCLAKQPPKYKGPNMNGDYVISATPKAPKGETFNTKYAEYDAAGVEYFDVYMGPITHRYSEVFWTSLPETPVPDNIVKRFAGKGMAITGYEVDQVMKKGDKDPYGKVLKEDTSVPINMAYNHHHDLSLLGAGSSMQRVQYDPADKSIPEMLRADPNFITVPVEHTPSLLGIPTSAGLHEGNGGEYRKSFHGLASPVAYLVDSPSSVYVMPMQIDTWNRDKMNLSGSDFVPYLEPKHSLAPQGPGAQYSGLLECPLTDKVVKTMPGGGGYTDTYATQIFSCPANNNRSKTNHTHPQPKPAPCGDGTATKCSWTFYSGAIASGNDVAGPLNLTTSEAEAECSKTAACAGFTFEGTVKVCASTACKTYLKKRADWSSATTDPSWGTFTRYPRANRPSPQPPVQSQCTHTIADAATCFAQAKGMVGIRNATVVKTSQGASATLAPGCTVSFDGGANTITAFFNTNKTATTCSGSDVTALSGTAEALGTTLEMTVSSTTKQVQITLTGPSAVWFGAGFYAQAMEDTPYTLIVDGAGAVTERRMANHAIGRLLKPTVSVVSNTVTAGMRTVVITRDATIAGLDYSNFTMTGLKVPIITAVGSTSALSYHKHKTASTLVMWPSAGSAVSLCAYPAPPYGSAVGTITYLPTGESFGFSNHCETEPRESVLAQKNPACDVRAYVGGLQVCKHMWSLLDAEQELDERIIAWKQLPLTYYQKYRIYFQEYVPEKHIGTIPRQDWNIAATGGEYDVPQCPPGTPVEECTWEIWGVLTPGPAPGPGDVPMHLAAMHFHCHAPTCLEMAIYNNVTGELLCSEKPIYGGTGRTDATGKRFDEPGYILQPPCLWGDAPGLEPMPLASGVKFLIKAITNSTHGHHGEMAFPEVTLVPWKANSSAFA